ncbi:YutD family protein [Furfurilactobacillus siliginis]|uniref:Transcriptional regulator n=1 Tax=Furfurilactobacillus siliginis TaxID=348151 RepID=A0A0R2L4S0_9LACO|nr:YutD family protein [Furfurilactobacillus siliginis]KRN93588.1 hypothetical protein IV55_GL001007 [Furfurilactobacillus siliginis]GEK29244.1 hypothetical protein LSI01_15550 [Furfurilactobacillus siliginis]
MTIIDREHIQQLAEEAQVKRAAMFTVVRENDAQFFINGHPYEVVTNFHDAFDVHKFSDRYSTVLSKYDFIVGDWGFDQLRLKGFYAADKQGAAVSQTVTAIQDYIYEYCNFGCAYFVLHNLDVEVEQQDRPQRAERQTTHRSRRRRSNKARTGEQTDTKQAKQTNSADKNTSHHQFETRQKNTASGQAHIKERKVTKTQRPQAGGNQQVNSSHNRKPGRRHFTIRQKSTSGQDNK